MDFRLRQTSVFFLSRSVQVLFIVRLVVDVILASIISLGWRLIQNVSKKNKESMLSREK